VIIQNFSNTSLIKYIHQNFLSVNQAYWMRVCIYVSRMMCVCVSIKSFNQEDSETRNANSWIINFLSNRTMC